MQPNTHIFRTVVQRMWGRFRRSRGGQQPLLRARPGVEPLEDRLVLNGPTVVTAAYADQTTVTGRSVTLHVLGDDPAGESTLTYTWDATGPAGASLPFYFGNGTNTAKDVVAGLQQAGNYTFTVTIKDQAGLSVTSTAPPVTVQQTLAYLPVNPGAAVFANGQQQQYTVSAQDQFGKTLTPTPPVTWSVTGLGAVTQTGLFTAAASGDGGATVTVSGANGVHTTLKNAVGLVPPGFLGGTVAASTGDPWELVTWPTAAQATSYNVYRSTTPGGEGTTPYATGLTRTSFTDTAVIPGTKYYYQVQSVAGARSSALTPEFSGTPAAGLGPDNALLVYNLDETKDEDRNGVQDSLQVAQYYAGVRGIPQGHILGLHFGPSDYTLEENATAWTNVFQPLQQALTALPQVGLIQFSYDTPEFIHDGNGGHTGWQANSLFSLQNALLFPFQFNATNTAAGNALANTGSNPYEEYANNPNWATNALGHFAPGKFTSGPLTEYLTAALDGPDLNDVYREIDGALYAEAYLRAQPGPSGTYTGNVLVDANGPYSYYNATIDQSATFLSNSTDFSVLNNTSGTVDGGPGAKYTNGSSATNPTDVAGYAGWYYATQYVNNFAFLPGAPFVDLESGSANQIRNYSPGQNWSNGGRSLYYGATATAGNVNEPFLNGAVQPQQFAYAFYVEGLSFAEAAVAAYPQTNWMGAAFGDGLYHVTPQGTGKTDTVAPALDPTVPLTVVQGSNPTTASVALVADQSNGPKVVTFSVEYGTTTAYGTQAVMSDVGYLSRDTAAFSGLQAGVVYHYRVTMTDAVGHTVVGPDETFVVGATPPVPTGVTATPGDGQVQLSWALVSTATTYSVYRSTTPGGEGSTPYRTGVTGLTFTDPGLTDGTTYYYKLKAVNAAGTSMLTAEVSATPTKPLAPAVTGVNPASVAATGGATITVSGSGFTNATEVLVGTTVVTTFTITSDNVLTLTAPPGTGAEDVIVVGPGGSSATSAQDRLTFIPAPVVGSVGPAAGPLGGGRTITITGTDLSGVTAVLFGTTPGTNVSVLSSGMLTVIAPAGPAGPVDITVVTGGGTSEKTSHDLFTYLAAPTVTGLSTSAGPAAGGTALAITGTGFSTATGVMFDGVPALSFTVVSDSVISAVAPAGQGTAAVVVTNPGGTSMNSPADLFTFVPRPVVSYLSSTAGPEAGGTTVIITGSGLTGVTAVAFGGRAAAFTILSDTTIVATSPAGTAGTDDVIASGIGGSSAASVGDRFTYQAVLTILPVAGQTKEYGADVPALSYTVDGLLDGDTSAVVSGALGTTAGRTSPVGAYGYTLGTLSVDPKYLLSLAAGESFAVTPAPLTVTANDAQVVAGTALPPFTASFAGFVLGEGPGVLDGTLSFSTPATPSSPPGGYAVSPSGLSSSQYTLVFQAGTLTITAAGVPPVPPVSQPASPSVAPVTPPPVNPHPPAGGAFYVVAAGPGDSSYLNIYDNRTNALITSFSPFDPNFHGGYAVALADVNGDGTPDIIVGAGLGGGPQVKFFSGKDLSLLANFYAFDPNFRGGVSVAAADLLGDGSVEVVVGAGPGGAPHVKVFDRDLNVLESFYAFDANFHGGVNVAAAGSAGQGGRIVATPASQGGPEVSVFDGRTGAAVDSFFAYDPAYRSGLNVAIGTPYGDGRLEVVTGAGPGGGPQVGVFDADTGAERASFFAAEPTSRAGVKVSVGDVAGDGTASILAATGGRGGSRLDTFDGFGNFRASLNAVARTQDAINPPVPSVAG